MEVYANAAWPIKIWGDVVPRDGLIDPFGKSPPTRVDKEYERKVLGTLDTIYCSQVGRLLLQSLNNTLDIYPYSIQDARESGSQNATTTPKNWDAAGERGTPLYDNGMPLRLASGDVRRYATGGGIGSEIHFFPDDWATSTVPSNRGLFASAGYRRDEVLFHEMAHALMFMAGCDNGSMPPVGFDTKREFWAVMATNIYSSAWNRPLRKNHQSGSPISQTDADALYLKYGSMVDWMCRDIPHFTRAVAQLEWIPFNPFRDSYKRQKAKLSGA
ncbi:MAG: hypothetical protein ABL985_00345 [Casimicrobium sp.]